jgi:hypothetical protein
MVIAPFHVVTVCVILALFFAIGHRLLFLTTAIIYLLLLLLLLARVQLQQRLL